jgi:hypothetical protein
MEEMRNEFKILVGKCKWKIPLVRHRRRWKDDIRIDLREIWSVGVDWIHLPQDMDQWQVVMNMVMNF